MAIDNLMNKKVSFQKNAWTPPDAEFTVKEVLDFIKKGRYASEITYLRTYLNNGDTEKYDSFKRRLPGVTFCATFNEKRKRDDLRDYNQLIVIDIDKLSQEELISVKEQLLNDHFVSCFWESPSQKGVKGIVQLDYNFSLAESDINASHKHAFANLITYFSKNYGVNLDISGSDITRLCFLSYDPNLVLKEFSKPFLVEKPTLTGEQSERGPKDRPEQELKTVHRTPKSTFLNPLGKNSPHDRAAIRSIIKFLKKRNKSITYSYPNWYRVAFAIANTFTFDIGEEYYLRLCRLDGAGHDEIQSKNLLRYCYENSKGEITFNTIVFLAKKEGYKITGGSEGASRVY